MHLGYDTFNSIYRLLMLVAIRKIDSFHQEFSFSENENEKKISFSIKYLTVCFNKLLYTGFQQMFKNIKFHIYPRDMLK